MLIFYKYEVILRSGPLDRAIFTSSLQSRARASAIDYATTRQSERGDGLPEALVVNRDTGFTFIIAGGLPVAVGNTHAKG